MPAATMEQALRAAAAERAEHVAQRSHRPSQRRDTADDRYAHRSPDRAASAASQPMRAQLTVVRDAAAAEADAPTLRGYATTYEQPYVMYDFYGPYTEVVTAGAGEATLNREPDVKFLFNHRGMPMARTLGPGTLQLSEDDHGLLSVAQPEMGLDVSRQVVLGIDRGLIDEMSFAFLITRGAWSATWDEYRIYEYEIDRGDTSAVTYGANPYTEIDTERAHLTPPAPAGRTLSPREQQSARRVMAGLPPL